MSFVRVASRGFAPLLVVLAVLALGLRWPPESDGPANAVLVAGNDGPFAGPFTISGDIEGLYPGAHQVATLTVHNPNAYALAVLTVDVAVGASNHPGCDGANVSAESFAGRLVVSAGGSSPLNLGFEMQPTAPDACSGAIFPLTYTGTAQRTPLPTALRAEPILLEVLPQTKLTLGRFTARLVIHGTNHPVVGRTVHFVVPNFPHVTCDAVTGANGVATCGSIITSTAAALRLRYRAAFDGDDEFGGSATTSPLIELRLP